MLSFRPPDKSYFFLAWFCNLEQRDKKGCRWRAIFTSYGVSSQDPHQNCNFRQRSAVSSLISSYFFCKVLSFRGKRQKKETDDEIHYQLWSFNYKTVFHFIGLNLKVETVLWIFLPIWTDAYLLVYMLDISTKLGINLHS